MFESYLIVTTAAPSQNPGRGVGAGLIRLGKRFVIKALQNTRHNPVQLNLINV